MRSSAVAGRPPNHATQDDKIWEQANDACVMSFAAAVCGPGLRTSRSNVTQISFGFATPVVARMPAVHSKGFVHMTVFEKDRIKQWKLDGKAPSEIAQLLGRDKSTVTRFFKVLSSRAARPGAGRPPAMTDASKTRLVSKAQAMIKVADATYQVTAGMIKKAMRLSCSDRVVFDALHEHGVYFRPLREKLVRTPAEELARLAWTQEHKDKSDHWWTSKVHAYIDNKTFPVHLDKDGRSLAAKRVARGAFRAEGDALTAGHVKPRRDSRPRLGTKNVMVTCAICADKVLMWHVVDGQWNGNAAVAMYKKLGKALRDRYGNKRSFVVLEDNDPSGYKCRKGIAAKSVEKIVPLEFPKRSPDLNPLDYNIWATVSKRMRVQEKRFKPSFRETRDKYLARLRRTALNMNAGDLTKTIRSMKRRCRQCFEANGKHFEE